LRFDAGSMPVLGMKTAILAPKYKCLGKIAHVAKIALIANVFSENIVKRYCNKMQSFLAG